VIYNGDNKSPDKKAHDANGNKKVIGILPFYFSKNRNERLEACPILVTKTVKFNDKTGFRKFIGIGIINEHPTLIQQYNKIRCDFF
jgi:hypothetical protein